MEYTLSRQYLAYYCSQTHLQTIDSLFFDTSNIETLLIEEEKHTSAESDHRRDQSCTAGIPFHVPTLSHQIF
jgi:hypothetical protein